ncbi:MAG: rhodanese-related sulfurtransferase [Pseudomonadota bacterium]
MTQPSYVVCALYRFVRLDNYTELKQPFLDCLLQHNVKGTILLAHEGINGTISGLPDDMDAVLSWIKSEPRLSDLSHKESYADNIPFHRSKVKLKKEIVTMGVENIDPTCVVGTYVKPSDWNSIISDPDVTVIDTRNEYEFNIGSFKNAINPHTKSFREFPQYVEDNLHKDKNIKVAMFCTGGIRCEKSTAYLKEQGFDEVYHLEGGILKYLEDVPKEESLWEGECFVFDNRVAVDHDLKIGSYDQCYACRHPITEDDKQRPEYEEGVSCHLCFDKTNEQQRKRFADREKQIKLAKERGEHHIGMNTRELQEARRNEKLARKNAMRSQDKQKENKKGRAKK